MPEKVMFLFELLVALSILFTREGGAGMLAVGFCGVEQRDW